MFDTNKIGNIISAISRWVQDIKCSVKLAANARFFQREICIKLSDTVIKAYAVLELTNVSSKIVRIELINGLQVVNPEVILCNCCSEGGGTAVTSKEYTITTSDPLFISFILPDIPTDVLLVFRDSQNLTLDALENGYSIDPLNPSEIILSESPNVSMGAVTIKVLYV